MRVNKMKSKIMKTTLFVIILIAAVIGIFLIKNELRPNFIEKRISMMFTIDSDLLKIKLHISGVQIFPKKNDLVSIKRRQLNPNLKLIGNVEIQNKSNSNIEYNLSGIQLMIVEEKCPTDLARPYVYIRYDLKINEIKKYLTYWLVYFNQIDQINEKSISVILDKNILRIKTY